MSADQGVSIAEFSVHSPITMAPDTIRRLNQEGLRERFKPLKIVDEAREALAKMPIGKLGLVLGSGPKTAEWRAKGWGTVDVDPSAGADYTADANYLEKVVSPGSQDFVHAESLTFSAKSGEEGVGKARLLQQANRVLKDGGTLVVTTAHQEGMPTNLPDRRAYAELMANHGFEAVTEVHEIIDSGESVREQMVIYYGRKVAEGFVDNRPRK